MCPCVVRLRPNEDTMDRTRATFAALKTPCCRAAVTLSRGKKHGHNQWQMDHAKAVDVKRGVRRRGRHTSVLSRWQNDETYRASQLAIGWTETYVKYLDYISTVDIKYEACCRQRHRYESTLFMRSLDPHPQAGPLWKREDFQPSANAFVSFQRDQGKGVPQIPLHLWTRQRNTLDPAVRQHLAWLSFNWQRHFSSSSSSTWTEKLNTVELPTLERFSTVERVATRRMATSKVVGEW